MGNIKEVENFIVENFLKEAQPAIDRLTSGDKSRIIDSRDKVYYRYQPIFTPKGLSKLKADVFYGFLLFENNNHWSGLNRSGHKLTADLPKLISALKLLLDESKPIADRLDKCLGMMNGMGKAISTAILHVAYPHKYGVWNNTSESGLIKYGLFPDFDRGESVGKKYEKINSILLAVSNATKLDLWTLDALWWSPSEEKVFIQEELQSISPIEESSQLFGLERHLHDFLRDNWEKTSLGNDWLINFDYKNDVIDGYEFPTPIGRIDLLAKHKSKPEWLIIELKRDQTADVTLGQILRYIGYVKSELCLPEESVKGLIIAHKADEKLKYALSVVSNVTIQLYEVNFRLKDPK